MSPAWPLWARSTRPEDDCGFVTARLEIVIRRYGVDVEPVLWQIVMRAAGVLVGGGVTVVLGHGADPMTTASPTWRMWARKTRPDCDFGLAHARDETLIRRHVSDPVL